MRSVMQSPGSWIPKRLCGCWVGRTSASRSTNPTRTTSCSSCLQAPAGTYPELEAEQARAFSYLHEAVQASVEAGLLEGESLPRAHYLWAQIHGLVSLHLAGKLVMGCSLEELVSTVFEKSEAAQ